MRTERGATRDRQGGFSYLLVLVAVALLGLGLTGAAEIWATSARRQQSEQLDWVGAQFVQAIGSYYEGSPGGIKAYPPTLQDLLQDPRYVTVRRHLRQVFRNPYTGLVDWELIIAPNGGIRGVRAPRQPATRTGAPRDYVYVPTPAR